MSTVRLGIALAFIAVAVTPVLLECTTTCRVGKHGGYVEGRCPVKLTSVLSPVTGNICVTIRVWMKADDLRKSPKIEIHQATIGSILSTRDIKKKWCKENKRGNNKRKAHEGRVIGDRGVEQLPPHSNVSFSLWELVHDCVNAEAESVISVSYSTTSTSCNVTYTVPDPTPDFDLSVNQSSKSITVTVEPGHKVYARWCYQKSPYDCIGGNQSQQITIDPSQFRSALLNIPYLLPCVCVQVYYTYIDSRRRTKCPFRNENLTDVRDVWDSSSIALYESSFILKSECPASDLKISTSLCWRQQEHLCTPVPNSTLKEKEGGQHFIYSTSEVDKHPQMCAQFSLQGSFNISCPFEPDMSSWELYIRTGSRSVSLYLTSSAPAKFSAQLCVVSDEGCTPTGEIHSVTMDGNIRDIKMEVPLYSLAEQPCVQVWQSSPFLHGRRILCPDYTHNRYGIYAVVILIFVVMAALLGILIHRLTKSGAAGWLCIQKPVLLVCSSEQSAHVSAVCALASILQGELSASVHLVLWALSSQTKTGVADLGPLPWLYGQWEAVRKAQGKVLIVWSPEGKRTYEKWRKDRPSVQKNESKKENYSKAEPSQKEFDVEMEEIFKLNGKCKKERAVGETDNIKLCDHKDWYPQREASTVIAPVFTAALTCLEGALQSSKGQGVALVYFQGLCHSRDIPKAFRGVPRYCLPQNFSGLIQELGGMRRQTKTGKLSGQCWHGLLSKVQSIWLARRLAQKLQTLLPHTQGQRMQELSVTSSLKMISDKTQRLKLPLTASTARPRTVQEHEPLHESPWRAEKL